MGSCCTLIASLLRSSAQLTPASLADCAALLEGAILLDTLNLSSANNKTTEEDVAAVRWLEEQRHFTPSQQELESHTPSQQELNSHTPSQLLNSHTLSQQELFNRLSGAKYDEAFWRSLTTEKVLAYDYKQWSVRGTVLGWSVALTPLREVVGREGFEDVLEAFARRRGVDGMVLSSVVLKNPPVREFMVCCTNEEKETFWKGVKAFETEMEKQYGCEREEGLEHLWRTTQPWSRKGVIPLLSSFFCRVCCSPPQHERIEQERCASGCCYYRRDKGRRDGVREGECGWSHLDANHDQEEDYMKKKRREREIKMNLIKLKAASRTIYGELHSITEKIEKEMQSSDTLLVDLNRMESEISSMKRTLVNYQSFSYVLGGA